MMVLHATVLVVLAWLAYEDFKHRSVPSYGMILFGILSLLSCQMHHEMPAGLLTAAGVCAWLLLLREAGAGDLVIVPCAAALYPYIGIAIIGAALLWAASWGKRTENGAPLVFCVAIAVLVFEVLRVMMS